MDGITILNVTEVSENSTLLLVALIFLVIGAIISTVNLLLSDDTEHCVLYGIFTFALLALSIVVGFTMDKDREANAHNQYECLIDSSASLEDVYEKYTVIERRGDIWVLEDKQVEKDK